MQKDLIKYAIWFFSLLVLQVVVLNNLEYSDLVIPFAYLFFILYLPRNINRSILLVLSFGFGLTLDVYSDTSGVHAMASTLIAFIRPFLLASMAPNDTASENIKPSIYSMGWRSYLTYAFICIIIHHLLVFYVEIFEWNAFFRTLLRAIFSSIASLFLISVLQVVFVRDKN